MKGRKCVWCSVWVKMHKNLVLSVIYLTLWIKQLHPSAVCPSPAGWIITRGSMVWMETLHGNAQHLLKREEIKVLEKILVPIAFECKCRRMNTLCGTALHDSIRWRAILKWLNMVVTGLLSEQLDVTLTTVAFQVRAQIQQTSPAKLLWCRQGWLLWNPQPRPPTLTVAWSKLASAAQREAKLSKSHDRDSCSSCSPQT